MSEKEYNLLDEPWIKVLRKDGTVDAVGLKKLFSVAHECSCLAGEMPTQDLSIMRLAIAVLYAVYSDNDINGNDIEIYSTEDALDHWNDIWSRGCFDETQISEYFETWRDRFYLFHPEWPFYQAPIESGTECKASKTNGELSESSNKVRFFSSMGQQRKSKLEYDEAARWLINLMNFDDTSSKPTPEYKASHKNDDDKASISTGWLGCIGPVYLEGSNLFETLVLNLVFANNGEIFGPGRPYWEKEPDFRERLQIPVPTTPVELMTLQSRRIKLTRENGAVVGHIIQGGDLFSREGVFAETMTSWKKNEYGKWLPREVDASKSLWRDYQSLIARSDVCSNEETICRRPGVIEWMSLVTENDYVREDLIKIRSIGARYDSYQKSSITDYVDDGLSINKDILSTMGNEWNIRIVAAVSDTEKCMSHMWSFCKGVLSARGLDPKDKQMSAKVKVLLEDCYFRLDQPFRRWISGIDPHVDDIESKMGEWALIIKKTLFGYADELIESSSSKALLGYKNESKDVPSIIQQYNWLKHNIISVIRGEK